MRKVQAYDTFTDMAAFILILISCCKAAGALPLETDITWLRGEAAQTETEKSI